MKFFIQKICSVVCCALLGATGLSGEDNIEVGGLGWLADRGMDQRLDFLLGISPDELVVLDSALLEDGAFLLLEQMRRKGYLRPAVTAHFVGASGAAKAHWETPYEIQLPVEFQADAVSYEVTRGALFFYASVEIEGLEEVDLEDAERFFLPGGSLFARKKDSAYTPENFKRRKGRLLAALEDLGYANAEIIAHEIEMDESTGAVDIRLEVSPGPVYQVGETFLKVSEGSAEWVGELRLKEDGTFNRKWLRDARAHVRQAAYEKGYPDAEVRSSLPDPLEFSEGMRQPVTIELQLGPRVRLRQVEFEGDPATRRSILRRQVRLESGDFLDPREIDRARRRLMALGIFRQVDFSYDSQEGDSRSVVYHLTEEARQRLQLLAGWGSYEQARVGFRWSHMNPWGRAHRYSLDTKQSMKATRVAAGYEIPQLFGSNVTGYSEVEYSAREEIGYDRSRQGGLVGVSKLFGRSGIRLSLEYGWFLEETDGIDANEIQAENDAQVASFSLRASMDRRDSALAPTGGYQLYAAAKTANTAFGGNVNFHKFEMGGSYHLSVSESTIMHFNLKGGLLVGDSDDLPFNERFFPGGENSVRGYRQGEASPLDAQGDLLGAESFWLGNFEIEQRLYSNLSFVTFADVVGVSRDGGFGGDGAKQLSVGMGMRYQTVVGPLRLEYGHNLNPRESDPSGTLHFAIGFPF
jgi:outer membrane protein assembly complex protein YaeT